MTQTEPGPTRQVVEGRRVLVVSHPSVISVNQAVYRQLAKLGWDVTLVVPDRWKHEFSGVTFAPEPLPELAASLRPVRIAFPGAPARHLYLANLARIVRRARPDVAFVEAETFSLPAAQWAWTLSRRGVPFGVQADENLDRHLPTLVRAGRSAVLRRSAFVAARSPRAAELVRLWGGGMPTPLIPHAVPLWDEVPPRHNEDTFTVGFAGRLVPEKGVLDLLEAVRALTPSVRLLIVGDGPLRSRLAAEHLSGGTIEIRTSVRYEDMPSAYREMDVLALPSRTTERWAEQFGRVLVEANSCGVPVVGSSSGEIPWVLETTRAGLVFPEGDVAALADALAQLRGDPDQRQQLGARGREAVERLFTEDAVALALDSALTTSMVTSRAGSRRSSEIGVPR